ncbi:MAG: protein arginine kinase [Phycisphaerales bacterium]|nr:protein arginine kinase [Phycisphaerales bacterium]
MTAPLGDVVRQLGEWLRGSGPQSDVVISTRIRLARNLRGFPFLSRASVEQRAELVQTLATASRRAGDLAKLIHVDVEKLDELDRQLLVERHIISRQHAEANGARAVAFDREESVSLMMNEEDHLRMQVIRSGLQLEEAWELISRVDDSIDQQVEYAYHAQFGYLTACPTNVGTGLRVSVMLHLPALRLTGELEKVAHAAREMKLAVRGLFGEGTEALGDFFQISNQITLGRGELDLIDDFRKDVIPKIIEYELAARRSLIKSRQQAVDDKIWRALGTLRNARLMSSNEAMQCLSYVRLGLHTGRLSAIDLHTVNELFLQSQQAHLQKLQGERLTGEQRSVVRAALFRSRLGHINQN